MHLLSIRLLFPCLLLAAAFPAMGQSGKITHPSSQLWLGYFQQTRLNPRWGIWVDVHSRRTDHFVLSNSKFFARVGLMYYLNDHVRATAGYMYGYHFAEGSTLGYHEHRPWQQLQWLQKYPRFQTMQWLRFEQRFRERTAPGTGGAYAFNPRIRYNYWVGIPLNRTRIEKGAVFGVLNDEIHLNFGKNIIYNHFDQNRFFAGLGYQLGEHTNLQAGYMHVYQQLASGNQFNSIHAIRIFVFHTLDVSKKE